MRLLYILPVALFLLLGVVFLIALQRENPQRFTSHFVGEAAPSLGVPTLSTGEGEQEPIFASDRFKRAEGGMSLVNFWASWCTPCLAEHPHLMTLAARDDIVVYGVSYKDTDEKARAFLSLHGNPFELIGVDQSGRAGIEWGITGVPETFVISSDGQVIDHIGGPLTEDDLERVLGHAGKR